MGFLETKYGDYLYVIFRLGIGALFFVLGVMKLFGLWGMPGGPAAFGTLIWYAGAGELLIGLSLITGALVRLASAFGIIEMIVAYYIGHVSVSGWNPAVNMGMLFILCRPPIFVTFPYATKNP